MKKGLALVLPLLLLAPVSPVFGADTKPCLDRTLMIDTLISDYGEQLAEVREIKGKGLLEFHVSPNDGTWTALLTDDDGVSCVVAVGEGIDPSKTITRTLGHEI
ncbi:MAG: hypothetical protein R3229_10905 [Alphaproteobacteria bacterium]|nr:hypothetical protein [Alphaproteobacteria bacterium]